MLVEWTAIAAASADAVFDYIAEFDEPAATRFRLRLAEVTNLLSFQPYIGRPGRIAGTREFVVHHNYILVYVVALDHLLIINVIHSRREYP